MSNHSTSHGAGQPKNKHPTNTSAQPIDKPSNLVNPATSKKPKKHVTWAASLKLLHEVFPKVEKGNSIDNMSNQATYHEHKTHLNPHDPLPKISSAAHFESKKRHFLIKKADDDYSTCPEQGSDYEGSIFAAESEVSLGSVNSYLSATDINPVKMNFAPQWPTAGGRMETRPFVIIDNDVASDKATIAYEDVPHRASHNSFVTGRFDYVPVATYVPVGYDGSARSQFDESRPRYRGQGYRHRHRGHGHRSRHSDSKSHSQFASADLVAGHPAEYLRTVLRNDPAVKAELERERDEEYQYWDIYGRYAGSRQGRYHEGRARHPYY